MYLCMSNVLHHSGVVLVYVALPMLEKHRGRFNYLVYVIHRWSRLTPALIGVICFIILMPVLGTGKCTCICLPSCRAFILMAHKLKVPFGNAKCHGSRKVAKRTGGLIYSFSTTGLTLLMRW